MEDILYHLKDLKDQNKSFVFCIITSAEGSTPRKEGAKMVVFDDGKTVGTIGGGSVEQQAISDALEIFKTRKPQQKQYILEDDLHNHHGGKITIYFEPVNKKPALYIFGAGHIGRETGKYAAEVGFNVNFVDQRSDIYKDYKLEYGGFISENYLDAAKKFDFSPHDFIVITTPKHEWDVAVMSITAKKDVAYVGMIGSKNKVANAKKRLLEKKANTEEELNRVDMPIGIPFNAETPREIAFSIIAKLIDVKNNFNL